MTATVPVMGGFDHRALVYERDEDFLAGTVPFVLGGLAEDGALDGHDGNEKDPGFVDTPLPDPPDDHQVWTVATGDRKLRAAVAAAARARGFAASRLDDLVLATQELAANTLRHGGGHGTLRLWGDGAHLTVEITDEGTIRDPLVGRYRPTFDQIGGRGLWIANQLSDLVQIRSRAGTTTVRLHFTTS